MKILFITPWYPDETSPNRGIFVRDQAVALSDKHEVAVVFARVDYESFGLCSFTTSQRKYKGISEHYIVIKRSLPVINQLVFFCIAISRTIKIARGFKPDVIHGNISYPGAFWSWSVSKSISRPFVLTEHTRLANNFRSWIHKIFTLYPLRKASTVIVVSSSLARELKQVTDKPVVVVPNIIDFSRYRESVNRPRGICQIGFLGGLNTPVKGLDLLLRAIAKIKHDFTLHIGGGGKLLESYKLLADELGISKRCIFYGFVHPDEVAEFMGRLNFFVSASRYETFGIAMVEAMACGLPVVATDSGGPADFITPVNGVLVANENAPLFRDALEKMMMDCHQYEAEAIRNFAINNYSAERFLERITDVYLSVIPR